MIDSTETADSSVSSAAIIPNSNNTNASQSSAGSTSSGSAGSSTAVDPSVFVKYLRQFVPALLDANNNNSTEFDKCLSDKANSECIKKFVGESQVRTLIIQKFLSKGKCPVSLHISSRNLAI